MCASRLLLGFLVAASGCGYTSHYAPPSDGRARALWQDDHIINNVPYRFRPPECHEATWWLQHPEEQPPERQLHLAPIVWVPRYYGADIVVVSPGVPPILPHPVLFSPSLTVANAVVHGGGGGGGGNLGKDAAVVLLVLAVVVLPIIDIVEASLHPESDQHSTDAIDEANAYNDLARSAGNPCSL